MGSMPRRPGIDSGSLLSAAVAIADEQGAEEITISSVAQRLGIRPPSLYNHVSGLAELRSMVAVHALNRLNESIEKATEGTAGEEAVRAFADAYLRYAREHPGLYEMIQLAPGTEDRRMEEASQRLVASIVALLEPYSLSEEEAIHTVRGLRSLIHGFATLERQGGFGMPVDVQSSLTFNLQLFLCGLQRRSG